MNPLGDSHLHPNRDKYRGRCMRNEITSAQLRGLHKYRPPAKNDMRPGPGTSFKIGETDTCPGVYMSSLLSEAGMHRGSSSVAGRSLFGGEDIPRVASTAGSEPPSSARPLSMMSMGESSLSHRGAPSRAQSSMASPWQGEPPLDRRKKMNLHPLVATHPTPYSSTCGTTHGPKRLGRSEIALNAEARRRWGLQHENPLKLDDMQLVWLCRINNARA